MFSFIVLAYYLELMLTNAATLTTVDYFIQSRVRVYFSPNKKKAYSGGHFLWCNTYKFKEPFFEFSLKPPKKRQNRSCSKQKWILALRGFDSPDSLIELYEGLCYSI